MKRQCPDCKMEISVQNMTEDGYFCIHCSRWRQHLSNKWISIKDNKPEWGDLVLVYRGKLDFPERYQFDNLPCIFETTRQFDSAITHWMPIPTMPSRLKNKP